MVGEACYSVGVGVGDGVKGSCCGFPGWFRSCDDDD